MTRCRWIGLPTAYAFRSAKEVIVGVGKYWLSLGDNVGVWFQLRLGALGIMNCSAQSSVQKAAHQLQHSLRKVPYADRRYSAFSRVSSLSICSFPFLSGLDYVLHVSGKAAKRLLYAL